MKIAAIIQARMGSTRLPGKVLKKVLDKPLLEYQIERIQKATLVDEIIIATTVEERDTPIVALCEQMGVLSYRGSEHDVLSRYFEAAQAFNVDVIVRLTSDCPLIDPVIIDKVIAQFLKQQPHVDYVSNTLKRTYPRGLDTEVFSFNALKEAANNAQLPRDREHVTSYFYTNPTIFTLENIEHDQNYSHYRWTVDTPEDFTLVTHILTEMYDANKLFHLEDVIQLLKEHPEWNEINANIEQKKL
ncbi:acylneuraminate cytidylyltransferase [Bacillus ginsengihumi]|uniref:Acylneuraminate cytidylyltransferase n=1 Tax=Heyndrickxia ginsengihumi TaxID=363870 RepID=A0A6M0P948_9BACI|nr:glycosyltransferase family protein [Heyndrickxia ginsengihumi]MBE6184824.1 acylneuraminate cytidylyltransferase [Bacillus sp. (in: firmicutes)]NEY21264.1 acylneuraminate cytidylyltransferase [Heyndrickxia ginsengihumi]